MQKSFHFSLTGKAWFVLFLFFYILMAFMVICVIFISKNLISGKIPSAEVIAACIGIFVFALALIGWAIPVYRKFIDHTEFDGKPFRFHGRISDFLGINLLGLFLSAITLFIYLPWYIRKVMNYIITHIDYDGKRLEFNGKGGKIFPTMLWAFYLPLVIFWVILLIFTAIFMDPSYKHWSKPLNQVLSRILFIPFVYKIYQFMFNNISWRDKNTRWNTQFWPSIGFIFGQLILLFITFFIYWPAYLIRIYRYFTARTEIRENDTLMGRFEFQGKTGNGFLLIWGQTLLSIITLGIYLPWGIARVFRWIAEETKYIPALAA